MNKRLIDFMAEAIRYSIESPSTVSEFEIVYTSTEPSVWKPFTVTIAPGFERDQWLMTIGYYLDGEHVEHYQAFKGMGLETWPGVMQFLIDCFGYMHNDMSVLLEYFFGWSEDTENRIDSALDELNQLKRFGLE